MLTPTSFNTDIASGRTELGFVPALSTVKRSPASRRNRPSAICDRAEFPVDGISKFISELHTTKLPKFGGLVLLLDNKLFESHSGQENPKHRRRELGGCRWQQRK